MWALWLLSSFRRCLFPESLGPANKAVLHGSICFTLSVSQLLGRQLMERIKCLVTKGRLHHTGKFVFLSIPLTFLKSKKWISTNKQHLYVISIIHLQDGTHSSGQILKALPGIFQIHLQGKANTSAPALHPTLTPAFTRNPSDLAGSIRANQTAGQCITF